VFESQSAHEVLRRAAEGNDLNPNNLAAEGSGAESGISCVEVHRNTLGFTTQGSSITVQAAEGDCCAMTATLTPRVGGRGRRRRRGKGRGGGGGGGRGWGRGQGRGK